MVNIVRNYQFKVGDIVRWIDPALEEYGDYEAQQKAYLREFEVLEVSSDGDVLTLQEPNGGTFVEAYQSECFPINNDIVVWRWSGWTTADYELYFVYNGSMYSIEYACDGDTNNDDWWGGVFEYLPYSEEPYCTDVDTTEDELGTEVVEAVYQLAKEMSQE